jgi:hypothetical protein
MTNSNLLTSEHLDEELDELLDGLDSETPQNHPPTTLRDAEGGGLVVVRGDFVLPPIKPVEIGEVFFLFDEDHQATFLVDASIMDDPKVCDVFFGEVLETYSEVLPPVGSFDPEKAEDFSSASIFTVDQMKREVQKLEKQSFLLQDHIARNSITLQVGDSGLGKSPFDYELGLCIASGLPFLGIPTTQGRVLYLDYEDDVDQMISLAETISQKLGLSKPPDTFRLWSPAMSESEPDPFKLIRVFRPDLVIIDTISAAYPKAEMQNDSVSELYNRCRDTSAAVLFVHHLKKNDSSDEDLSFDLDLDRPTTVRDFLCVRGASALYNNAYLRLKLIRARKNEEDWAFIVRGYRRGKGHVPTLSVGRVLNNNGEPIGHYRLRGLDRLSPRHREVFTTLPEEFRWKDLASHFKGNGSKQIFIASCEGAGVLSPKKKGDYYVKRPDSSTP